jgi:catechol 2,3-dioxygenase-like lactoylglutathione lyase family enzyme
MATFQGFDHIDMRVASLAAVEPFYDAFLSALGLTKTRYMNVVAGEWNDADDTHPANAKEYYGAAEPREVAGFLGVIEDGSPPSATRIAFRVSSPAELHAYRPRLLAWGARAIEWSEDMDTYPALFFEDPIGTRLELCARNPSRRQTDTPS